MSTIIISMNFARSTSTEKLFEHLLKIILVIANDDNAINKGNIYIDEINLVGKLNIGKLPPRTQEITINPSTSEIVETPESGYTGFSQVTVNAVTSNIDSNIIPTNIKEGVEILGVVGTYEQGYFTSVSGDTLTFGNSDRPISVNESELILE